MARSLPLAITLLLFFFSCQATAQTYKIATLAPDGTVWMEEIRKGADEIARRTDGRVAFRFYPGGIMGNDKSVLRKIRVGQLQGGALTGGGLLEIYPDSQIYSLPLAFHSYDEVDYVRSKMDDLIKNGLEERGYVSFGLGEGGFAYLMSNEPIRTSDDLKTHKVWIPEGDEISRTGLEALDVSPIPLPLIDVLTGLQTGLIDTIAASPTIAIALQWHTRVKYVTDTPLMYLYGILIVQRRAFEKMSPPDQAVVREVMENVFHRLNEQSRLDDKNARQALEEQGIKFVEPVEEDRLRWNQKVIAAMDRLSQRGFFSKTTLKTFRSHLDDFRTRTTDK